MLLISSGIVKLNRSNYNWWCCKCISNSEENETAEVSQDFNSGENCLVRPVGNSISDGPVTAIRGTKWKQKLKNKPGFFHFFFFFFLKSLFVEKRRLWQPCFSKIFHSQCLLIIRRILKIKMISISFYYEEVLIVLTFGALTFSSCITLRCDSWKGIANLTLSENLGHHLL